MENGLLQPAYIDENTGYRFYETAQLEDISKIKFLRQIGFSILEIKNLLNGAELTDALFLKRKELENDAINISYQLKTIDYLFEDKNMKYQVVLKKLPTYIVYYEERVLEDYSHLTDLVLSSAEECMRLNPKIECVSPDYCFVEYLDGEYKEKNIKARYS